MSSSTPLGGLPRPPITKVNDHYTLEAPWAPWFSTAQGILQDVSRSGAMADRPTTSMYTGKRFFDTTLGKPIWWNGAKWVDATGTAA